MKLKVYGGTASSGENLCVSCRYAHITRSTDHVERVMCRFGGHTTQICKPLAECNKYQNAAQPSLYDMEEIAWRLVTTKGSREAGFVSAEKFRKLEDEGRITEQPGTPIQN